MEILIKKTNNGWVLSSDGNLLTKKYGTLLSLAKALVKWAKGQGL